MLQGGDPPIEWDEEADAATASCATRLSAPPMSGSASRGTCALHEGEPVCLCRSRYLGVACLAEVNDCPNQCSGGGTFFAALRRSIRPECGALLAFDGYFQFYYPFKESIDFLAPMAETPDILIGEIDGQGETATWRLSLREPSIV